MNVEYDRYGRMKYCPELHPNHGKKWSEEDLEYMRDYYSKIGPEEMSLALGRPMTAVLQKASIMGLKVFWQHKRIQKKTSEGDR